MEKMKYECRCDPPSKRTACPNRCGFICAKLSPDLAHSLSPMLRAQWEAAQFAIPTDYPTPAFGARPPARLEWQIGKTAREIAPGAFKH